MSVYFKSLSFLIATLLIGSVCGCSTTITGATWQFDWNSDEEYVGYNTVEECAALCERDHTCLGYTLLTNGVASFCYKFKNQLTGRSLHACDGCVSGTMPENLVGACSGSIDDVLAEGTAENVEECNQYCHETAGCSAFTWFNASTPFANSCFLYTECDTQVPCYGCSTARINCITSPQQCYQHFILSEESRRSSFYDPDDYVKYCDKSDKDDTSAMWKGEGYYRFVEPAGTRMAASSPGSFHCGTHRSGWLNGRHPTEIGEEVEVQACFGNGSDECDIKLNITVTKCPGFFVYYLLETGCYLRYCGAH